MMNDCCDIKVTEVENGYRIEVTGDDVKEKCKDIFDNCCSAESIKKCCEACCEPKK